MIKKTLFFISLAVFAIYIATLVIYNSDAVDLVIFPEIKGLTKGLTLTNYYLGVVFLISVFAGFIIAWLLTFYLVFVGVLKRKKVEYDYKKSEQFIESILAAREAESARNWEKAKSIWLKIQSKDPSKVFANVEISKILEYEGKVNEALSLIDKVRAEAPDNIEVLFRAVELNIANSNITAALDNLALIMSKQPNQKAALKARNLSFQINRLNDALEYNDRAADLGSVPDYNDFKTKIELQEIVENDKLSADEKKKQLNKVIKKNKSYSDSYLLLAELYEDDGEINEAISQLLKASQVAGNHEYRHQAVKLMIANNQPDKALATVNAALKNTEGLQRIQSLIDQIKVNLILNKLEDAEKLIKEFPDKIADIGLSDKHASDFLCLKGLCLNRLGKSKEAAKVWINLSNKNLDITDDSPQAEKEPGIQKLDPRFSTP